MTILIGRLCAVTGTVTGTLPSFLLYHLIHILDQHSFQHEPFVVINVRLNATYLLFHKPLLNHKILNENEMRIILLVLFRGIVIDINFPALMSCFNESHWLITKC